MVACRLNVIAKWQGGAENLNWQETEPGGIALESDFQA